MLREIVYLDVVHNHHLEDRRDKRVPDELPQDVRIKELLNKRSEFRYSEVPLHKFLGDVSEASGINLHLDRKGLAAEGLTENEPITINISQPIRISSALELVLSPLHLKYIIEDEVVKITSEQTGNDVFPKCTTSLIWLCRFLRS